MLSLFLISAGSNKNYHLFRRHIGDSLSVKGSLPTYGWMGGGSQIGKVGKKSNNNSYFTGNFFFDYYYTILRINVIFGKQKFSADIAAPVVNTLGIYSKIVFRIILSAAAADDDEARGPWVIFQRSIYGRVFREFTHVYLIDQCALLLVLAAETNTGSPPVSRFMRYKFI